MPSPSSPPVPDPGAAPDGTKDTLRSGVWVAKPFVPVEAFPEALVLTEADRRLARKLARPVVLCRRKVGAHVVELLLERGEDRSVDLSLRIPTAENQFKDPYILMEAEPGNTREIGVREIHFHLQGRLREDDLAAADWAGYFAAAARKLAALRGAKRPRKTARPARRTKAAARTTARPKKARPARHTKPPARKRSPRRSRR
jgi:hypothetical protein